MVRPLELLDEDIIRSHLKPRALEHIGAIYIHDRIDSTNCFLRSAIAESEVSGIICLAESQTAGKGRSGRRWISPFGHNVYFSLAWQYPSGPANVSGISLAIGVAVIRALTLLGISDLGLKWPNDILWKGKKLGGILIEVSGDINGPCKVIIGLGLNTLMSREEGAEIDQDWVDLETITHSSSPNRNYLVATLINETLPLVAEYDKTGLDPFLVDWRNSDCMIGKSVVLHIGGQKIAGIVAGISDDGLIQLDTGENGLRTYASGEVSFHP